MPRGGKREGAGRKATWLSGPTKTVKIPVVLIDRVMAHARQLDQGAPAEAPAERDWDLLEQRIQEAVELTRRLQQVEAERDAERRRADDQQARLKELRARVMEAIGVLGDEVVAHERGERRNVRLGEVKRALDLLEARRMPTGPSETSDEQEVRKRAVRALVAKEAEARRLTSAVVQATSVLSSSLALTRGTHLRAADARKALAALRQVDDLIG